ncbi:MAG: EamA/RhaT family transporter [Ruminococcaceae bacterium]|nr:EamA/RhaT family transporter [Oscillospiraceae bacterium]
MNKLRVIVAMLIFGTIGIFVDRLAYPSAFIALFRSVCGLMVLLLYAIIFRKRISLRCIFSNILLLLPAGAFLGLNWVFLFEAYRYTSISFATLCYYMAPVFVIFLAPLFTKKKSGAVKNACALVAVAGMILLTGIQSFGNWRGLVFGLGAALLYALIILLTAVTKNVSSLEITVSELFVSCLVLIPYVMTRYDITAFTFDRESIVILVILGVVHTGIAYLLYFGGMKKISPQTVAVYSYIDPIFAIVLSSVLTHTFLTVPEIVGAVMILGAAFVSDMKK